MTTEQPDGPADPPPTPKPRKHGYQSSFLALGIVFLAVGIGMSFGDSSTWIPFLALGITFLALSNRSQGGQKD